LLRINKTDATVVMVSKRLTFLLSNNQEGCEGAILLYFRARAETVDGFLSHTMLRFLRLKANDSFLENGLKG